MATNVFTTVEQVDDYFEASYNSDWAKSTGVGTAAGKLESLEYLFSEIQLCETIDDNGSG